MLGPLKFGLQSPVSAVKAAAAPGRFELIIGIGGFTVFDAITLKGPPGATGSLTSMERNGPQTFAFTIPSSGIFTYLPVQSTANDVTLTGSNLITEMYIRCEDSSNILGITGTYPTALKILQIGFNHVDPVFTPPNVEGLLFAGKAGPSSLTTGSNLTRLDFPPNLTSLNLSASTKLNTLPPLPYGLTFLRTPPGLTVLPALPSTLTTLFTYASPKLTTINLSGCTGITNLGFTPFGSLQTLDISNCRLITDITSTYYKMSDPNTRYRITAPSLTNLRIDGSGLTYLDLTGTNVTTLNIPPEMYAQLEYLKLSGSKVKVSGLLKYPVPSGAKWILY
jgi:hypothetical protein